MNKYYLVIIKTDSQAIVAIDSLDEAKANFHHEMEYAYTAKIETTCMIVDKHGNIMHPVEENTIDA